MVLSFHWRDNMGVTGAELAVLPCQGCPGRVVPELTLGQKRGLNTGIIARNSTGRHCRVELLLLILCILGSFSADRTNMAHGAHTSQQMQSQPPDQPQQAQQITTEKIQQVGSILRKLCSAASIVPK